MSQHGPDFFETGMGRKFYECDFPNLVESLQEQNKLYKESMELSKKNLEINSELLAIRKSEQACQRDDTEIVQAEVTEKATMLMFEGMINTAIEEAILDRGHFSPKEIPSRGVIRGMAIALYEDEALTETLWNAVRDKVELILPIEVK